MAKKISKEELNTIAAIVTDHPDGVQVRIIQDGLEFDIPLLMLQSRLNLLTEQGRILVRGTGKGTRYFPTIPVKKTSVTQTEPGGIKLSREGKRLKKTFVAPYPFVHP